MSSAALGDWETTLISILIILDVTALAFFHFNTDTMDYVPFQFERTFSSSTTNETICVNVTIVDDDALEGTESFLVTVTSSDSVYLAGGPATVFIVDNDGNIDHNL